MGNVSRGRRLLMAVLGLYLAAVAWAYVRYPPEDFAQATIRIGLWVALPVILSLLAGFGAGWARRALAVVWGLYGVLNFLLAQKEAAALGAERRGATLEDALTPALMSVWCVLAAVVVLVQRDIREMTRPRW